MNPMKWKRTGYGSYTHTDRDGNEWEVFRCDGPGRYWAYNGPSYCERSYRTMTSARYHVALSLARRCAARPVQLCDYVLSRLSDELRVAVLIFGVKGIADDPTPPPVYRAYRALFLTDWQPLPAHFGGLWVDAQINPRVGLPILRDALDDAGPADLAAAAAVLLTAL